MSGPINRIAAAVTGRHGRWLTLAVWVLLAVAGLFAHAHLGDVTAAGQSSYLPSNAESTRAVDVLQRSYKGGNDVPVLVVFDREGGLTQADLDAIGRLGNGLERLGLTGATPVFAPYSGDTDSPLGGVARIAHGVGPISRDGEAALVALAIDSDDRGAIVAGVAKIRRYLDAHRPAGLHSYITGPGGIAADLEHVAEDAGKTLLFATLGLVLLLLLLVYRAPILAPLPLLAVGSAYLVASGIVYLLIEAGLIAVNTEGTLLLLVLIFGAGTDYSLLLIHRYREELGSGKRPAEALPLAIGESVPAVAASAATVIAAMLVLLVAELEFDSLAGTDPRDRRRDDAPRLVHPAARAARPAWRARLLAGAATALGRSGSPLEAGRRAGSAPPPRDRRHGARGAGAALARQPGRPRDDRLRPG